MKNRNLQRPVSESKINDVNRCITKPPPLPDITSLMILEEELEFFVTLTSPLIRVFCEI